MTAFWIVVELAAVLAGFEDLGLRLLLARPALGEGLGREAGEREAEPEDQERDCQPVLHISPCSVVCIGGPASHGHGAPGPASPAPRGQDYRSLAVQPGGIASSPFEFEHAMRPSMRPQAIDGAGYGGVMANRVRPDSARPPRLCSDARLCAVDGGAAARRRGPQLRRRPGHGSATHLRHALRGHDRRPRPASRAVRRRRRRRHDPRRADRRRRPMPAPRGCHLGVGSQTFEGGPGNDVVFGERGNDTLRGGAGNDRLFGGIGDDRARRRPGQRPASPAASAPTRSTARKATTTSAATAPSTASSTPAAASTRSATRPGSRRASAAASPPASTELPAEPAASAASTSNLGAGGENANNGHRRLRRRRRRSRRRRLRAIIGTPFSDYIVGTAAAETIYGGGGADVILGEGGGDTLRRRRRRRRPRRRPDRHVDGGRRRQLPGVGHDQLRGHDQGGLPRTDRSASAMMPRERPGRRSSTWSAAAATTR